ncbi:MAG: translation initiation factor IF-2, partial [Candidatus Binatus sp.]
PQLPPDQVAKPGGGRGIKKKKVVKKGSTDLAAEREMRGLRVPKKRRALPGKEQRKTEITTPKASKRVVRITEGVTVGDLGRSMGVKAGDLIKKLMELGQMATLNQVLDVDTATLLAGEFGYSVENVSFDAESAIEEAPEEAVVGESVTRPPVVTVMGHVDHGKTSLLDAIRHTNVTAREFGGITQHIGAYTVEANGRTIAFVDTPGHEAFTAMRARGAKVTDIVVLVVAANEGVMPQTQEAINHARAANVPIIVAINKIDLPDANIDNVKQRLTQVGLVPEDYGGDTIVVPVSARTGEGIDKLLEMILLQADVMELKANPARAARGTIIESQLDRGRGPVATVLIQEGTLHQGDPFVSGVSYGRVRAMQDHLGQRRTEAGPSTPVEIFGLSSVPEPGTVFTAVVEESKARQVAEYRRSKQREGELAKTSRISLEDLSQRLAAGEVKELKVILKGDVQGSVEALADSLARLSTEEVKLEVIHASAGAISETDVTLASASKAIIIGFNIRPEPKAASLAEKEGVEIRLYTVIYEAINDMREAMEGLLAPTYREKALGRAEVRKIFSVPGATVAGCMVVDGKIVRSARAAGPRRPPGVGRQAGHAQALQGRRARSHAGLRMRYRARKFQRRETRRHHRSFRDGSDFAQARGAQARDRARSGGRRKAASALDCAVVGRSGRASLRVGGGGHHGHRRHAADPVSAGESFAQGQTTGAARDQGSRPQQVQRVDRRVRQPRHVAARRVGHRAGRQRSRVRGPGAARGRQLYRFAGPGPAWRRAARNHQLLRAGQLPATPPRQGRGFRDRGEEHWQKVEDRSASPRRS